MKRRLDKYLSDQYNTYSRTYIQKLIQNKYVTVNALHAAPDYKLQYNDLIKARIPDNNFVHNKSSLPDILHEDKYILVINKPAGLNVHPPSDKYSLDENHEVTLSDILYSKYPYSINNSEFNKSRFPGIIHRLDKETSGIIIIAKTPESQFSLSKQFSEHTVKKTYLGIAFGNFSEKNGIIEAQITRNSKMRNRFCVGSNGKESVTEFKVLKQFKGYSYLEIHPVTGRTHQIRVHLSHINHPIAGDKIYSKMETPFYTRRHMLHSYRIKIVHPKTGKPAEYTAKIPADFMNTLKILKNQYA